MTTLTSEKPPDEPPLLSRRARLLLIGAGVFIALLLLGPPLAELYVNWLWFGEVGFRGVWFGVLSTRAAIFVTVALAVGGAIFVAAALAYRSRPAFTPQSSPNDPIAPIRQQVMRRPRLFLWGTAIAIGGMCGLIAERDWMTVQLFVHGGSFGTVDPEFGYDIGFFVFDLPFYGLVLGWMFVAAFLALLANLVTHYLFGGLRIRTPESRVHSHPAARIQLAVMTGSFIALKAVAYWFDRYWLLSAAARNRPSPEPATPTSTPYFLPSSCSWRSRSCARFRSSR